MKRLIGHESGIRGTVPAVVAAALLISGCGGDSHKVHHSQVKHDKKEIAPERVATISPALVTKEAVHLAALIDRVRSSTSQIPLNKHNGQIYRKNCIQRSHPYGEAPYTWPTFTEIEAHNQEGGYEFTTVLKADKHNRAIPRAVLGIDVSSTAFTSCNSAKEVAFELSTDYSSSGPGRVWSVYAFSPNQTGSAGRGVELDTDTHVPHKVDGTKVHPLTPAAFQVYTHTMEQIIRAAGNQQAINPEEQSIPNVSGGQANLQSVR